MMVGNDIVDVKETLRTSSWRRAGFVKKVFHPSEQVVIGESIHPFHTIWRMWSMKESAYKLFFQFRPKRIFNPTAIKCEFISPQYGMVYLDDLKAFTETKTQSKFIFTGASFEKRTNMENQIFHLAYPDHRFQSESIRQNLLEHVSRKQNLQKDRLCVKKINDSGVPFLYYNDQKLDASISLTHHGHYGAFSYMDHQKK